jgi:hypothetical protein
MKRSQPCTPHPSFTVHRDRNWRVVLAFNRHSARAVPNPGRQFTSKMRWRRSRSRWSPSFCSRSCIRGCSADRAFAEWAKWHRDTGNLDRKGRSMNKRNTTQSDQDAVLDTFAAEVTDATYPIALKYGVLGSSLDFELEIWKTITELVRKRGRDLLRPQASTRPSQRSCRGCFEAISTGSR